MGHDWVFDVLRDLGSYARQNDLPALAAKVEEARVLAEAEIAQRLTAASGQVVARGTSRAH
jgi:hypothetical protein